MGLTTEHGERDRPAQGYETVPLLIAGAGRNGLAVLRRRTARPSRRAVVYVHCLDDSFVPADLAGWYTDRGFHFYAADLRALDGGPGKPEANRPAGELGRYFACLDAAVAHLHGADAIDTVVVSAHAAGALFAALWCHARRGSQPVDALILAGPDLGPGRRWPSRPAAARANGAPGHASPLLSGAQRRLRRGLEIACPVLVMCPAANGHGPGSPGGLLPVGVLGALGALASRRATIRLGEHVTWLTLDGGLPGQAPAPAPEHRRFQDELGRWLSAYLSGQIRDQLLLPGRCYRASHRRSPPCGPAARYPLSGACERGDHIVTAMPAGLPAPSAPVTTIAEAIVRMEAIGAALPAADGLACFNRMYLDVTRQIDSRLGEGFFADPAFMTQLDVTFASLYFGAVDASGDPASAPLAWRPLVERRADSGIEPVQFALAGMNAHINHDLPMALVSTCTALATSPEAGVHSADYQKVDQLLDAAEQSIRQSFESAPELAVDHHLTAVSNLIGNWTINSARDLAWNNCLLLWAVRDDPIARGLLTSSLASSAAIASRLLLVAV